MANNKLAQEYQAEPGRICLHLFTVGDVEDPDIAWRLAWDKFLDTDKGQWIQEHAVQSSLQLHRQQNFSEFNLYYAVTGKLKDPSLETLFYLQWPKGK